MFSISNNIKKVAKDVQTTAKKVDKGVKSGVTEVGKYVVQQEKALLTPHKKSGKLYRSIKAVPTGPYSTSVGPFMDHFYPICVEKGRGDVYPVKAKALHYTVKGKEIFSKHSKPAKAEPFVAPTRKALNVMYPKIMQTEIKKAIR